MVYQEIKKNYIQSIQKKYDDKTNVGLSQKNIYQNVLLYLNLYGCDAPITVDNMLSKLCGVK